ncbi:MAG TPA: DNA lyase [Solirubrobacteraceae bacterium]|nr:DNA lyase [Solirubrobacteraceae bacterium]
MPASWKPPTRARVSRIRDRLREVYGIPRMAPHGRPLDELVLTVLSQSTNDRNRDVAFLRLRERFARGGGERGSQSPIDYAAVLAAPVSEVEQAIRPGGISKVKSARIQAILAAVSDPERREAVDGRPSAAARDGRPGAHGPDGDPLSLEWMRTAPIEQSRAYLCALPGVGRKTAACVLLFSYGLPDIPVDTHVSRVGTRLGLFRPGGRAGTPSQELHDQMLAITPPGQELEFHVNLLRHGRRTCHARTPACDECALARMCPSRVLFTHAEVVASRRQSSA